MRAHHVQICKFSIVASVPLSLLFGCAVQVPDKLTSKQPALISLADATGEAGGVQLIVMAIDGTRPGKAGPVIDASKGGPADRSYEAGTVVSQPPLRPSRWDFAVDPGSRDLSLLFAVPGKEILNLLAVTLGQGSEATGLRINVLPGCQYQIAATLTVLGGREIRPEVRWVRPIPSQFGLPPAVTCPARQDVLVTVVRSAG